MADEALEDGRRGAEALHGVADTVFEPAQATEANGTEFDPQTDLCLNL